MNILFVASEVAPFAKTGGLADVAGSLPQKLREKGHDVRVVMPEYAQIPDRYKEEFEHILHFRTNVCWRNEYVGINGLKREGITTYFVDNKNYFHRETLYENEDKHLQFAYFARAVLEMLPGLGFKPDVIHCNDWQTGPIALMLKDNYQHLDFYSEIKTVFTIHNLRYQGHFSPNILTDVLGVDRCHWTSGNIRHNGLINYMKTGIMYADIITTVSKTYALEIKTPYYGEGLDYALRMRGHDLKGIVNGISYDQFDPRTDKKIYFNYSRSNPEPKLKNKRGLQEEMGLPVRDDIPVIGIISRLVEQKGFDLITAVFAELMQSEIQFILLGTGQSEYENFFKEKASRYPDKLSVNIRYDAALARKIYAGSDMFLLPSRFEPCGLGQLIAMRYGTIPIVRETGGLNDTVRSYNAETGAGYGFTFSDFNAHDMLYTVRRAIYYYKQPDVREELVDRVMGLNFSWQRSAEEYLDVYRSLTGLRRETPAGKTNGGKQRGENEKDKNGSPERIIPANGGFTGELEERKAEAKAEKSPAVMGDNEMSGQININTADREVLEQLAGIGPAYAQRILKYRKEKGRFKNTAEIKEVKGIGAAVYNKLKDKIRVR